MICIYGGGVVGLCLAAHFEKLNIPYKIFLKEEYGVGYGLTIQEADNILHYLDLKPDITQINYLNRYVRIDKECNIISSTCHSKGNYVIPRVDLIKLFKTKIKDDNIIKLNNLEIDNLIEYDDCVKFNIGPTNYTFDYIVGCDGVNSRVRKFTNIRDEDLLVDTNYVIKFFNFNDDSIFKCVSSDVIECIVPGHSTIIRIFIKPNGNYGATMQIVHHEYVYDNNLERYIPGSIYKEIKRRFGYYIRAEDYHKSILYTSNKIIPKSSRIILCGDSLHPMIPYHGSGANSGIINAHKLALLFNKKTTNIASSFYDNISETYEYVNQAFNTFYRIHNCKTDNKNAPIISYNNICLYDPKYLMIPTPVNYISNKFTVEVNYNLTAIVLAGIGITTFPEQLYNVINLKVINLNDNNLTEIPINIRLFDQLKELYLRNNSIRIIPDEINQLYNLEILRLSYNHISNLENLNLKNIKELCLTGNEITEIPENINKMNSLIKLYISDNNIIRIANLNSLTKLKYFRIGFNPITYNEIYNSIDNILHMFYELRVSYEQTIGHDITDAKVNIKYGCTMNKIERKYFDIKRMPIDNDKTIEKTIDLFENYINETLCVHLTGVDTPITFNNNSFNNNMLSFVVKLNLLNTFDIFSKRVNTVLEKIIFTKHNIQYIMTIFTLYLTGNVILNTKHINNIVSYIKLYFNEKTILFLLDQVNKKIYTNDKIKQISKLYKQIDIKFDFSGNNTKYPPHFGYPLNPETGRPFLSEKKCYYYNCTFANDTTTGLVAHLHKNVSNFIEGYHYLHDIKLPLIIQKYNNSENMNFRCPVECCKYDGDMVLHMKQLGFKPFWKVCDVFTYGITSHDFKIYTSDSCMICLNDVPEVLYNCGHKVLCVSCCSEYLKTNMKTCMLCNNALKYFFIY